MSMRFNFTFLLIIFSFSTQAQFSSIGVIGADRLGLIQLNRPTAATFGSDGLLYFINEDSNQILVYSADGTFIRAISTILNDEPFRPNSIAINTAGLIYLSSAYTNAIAVLDHEGHFQQLIGSYGSNPDQLYLPTGIALDGEGNIWVADYGNNRVKKFSGLGIYISEFVSVTPDGIAITNNAMYVTEFNSRSVKKYTLNGVLTDEIEFPDSPISPVVVIDEANICVATANGIFIGNLVSNSVSAIPEPQNDYRILSNGLALRNGKIFITDLLNRVFAYDLQLNSLQIFLNCKADGQFNGPSQMAIDNNQNIYIVDSQNHRVQVFNSEGNFIRKFGSYGFTNGELSFPQDIAVDVNGDCYVLNNNGVAVFNNQGVFLRRFSVEGYGGIAVDENYVYVAGSGHQGIQRLDKNGVFLELIIQQGTEPGKIDGPKDFIIDEVGNLYITEVISSRVQVFDNNGISLQVIGQPGYSDGEFIVPQGIARDDQGRIYVTDFIDSRVQVFDPLGNFTEKIGNGRGTSIGFFNNPAGIAVSSNGRVYIADFYNQRIQIFEESKDLEEPEISIDVSAKTYGDPQFELEVNSNSDGELSYRIVEGSAAEISQNGIVKIVGVGQVKLEVSQTATSSYGPGVASALLDITKAVLQVYADAKIKVYGEDNPEFTYQLSGFRYDDDVATLDVLPVGATSADLVSPPGEYPIWLTGGMDNSYEFVYTNGVLNIEKAHVTVAVNNATRLYGEPDPEFSVTYTGFKNADSTSDLDIPAIATTSTTVHSSVGEYELHAGSALDVNYSFEYVPGIFTINKAQLVVTAEDKEKVYGEVNPTLTFQYSGFKNNEDQSALSIPPVASTAADESSPVGDYTILVQSGDAMNYEFVYEPGTLTINKANQQLVFGELPSPVFNTLLPFQLEAFSNSELPISYAITSGPADVVGDFLTLSGELGLVTVEASQPGNENYNDASPVSRSFEVTLDPVLSVEDAVNSMRIYPNPARRTVFLQTSSLSVSEITLVSATGSISVASFKQEAKELAIDVSGFSDGIYVLQLKTNSGKVLMSKLLIRN
jgi:sugar lactone lactonase YvrE